jgi:carboxypeptidase family protein
MKSTALWVVLVCFVLILVPAVVAQETNGTVQGTVADAGGAVVAGADVTVVNDSTAYTRTTTSGTDGSYSFAQLPPGHYHVKVTKQGFKTETQQDVELHAASTVVLNVKLTVGSVSESLTVEANPIAVETTTATLGNITEGAQVRELPLNGLNFIGLTLLLPGASTQDGFNASTKGVLGGSDISFSGGQRTGNVFTQDGVPDNDMGSQRTILLYPTIDAISEIKVVTNNYGAEYGQSGGAQVNIVTKSGTNALHGSVYYFGRNDALNANNWFNTNTTPVLPKGELRRNDFGFSVGGPIKKDKLFFFYSQEFNREVDGDLHAGQTPSAAELAGNFNGITPPAGTVLNANDVAGVGLLTNCYYNSAVPDVGVITFPVTDPASGTVFGNNPGQLQNISQTSEGFSTGGKILSGLYPAANVTPTASDPCPNPDYKQILKSPVNLWQIFGRVDYILNKSTTLMVTYTQSHWVNPAPSLPGGEWGDTGFPAVDSSWAQPSKVAAIRLSRTVGSTAVNDFQFSYSGNRIYITTGGNDPGLAAQFYADAPPNYPLSQKTSGGGLTPPVFWGPGGYSTLWNAAPWYNRMDRYTWTDDYSKVVGKHQFKFGALLSHNVKDQANNGDFNESPQFWGATGGPGTCLTGQSCTFPGGPWGGPFNGSHATTGNGLASILLNGSIFGYSESSNLHEGAGRYQDYEFYGGDSWRATRRLTVNYGVRWSILMQPYTADNELSVFNPNVFNITVPGADAACNGLIQAPGAKVNCTTVGLSGGFTTASDRSIAPNSYHNIAPRIGVAWDVFGDGKTSIRAGAGQFFVRYQLDPFIIQGTQNPPYIAKASDYRYLDGTVPGGNGGTGFGYPTFGRSTTPNIPNNWQWNFSVSRELFRNNTMQLSYVGNRGIHLQNYTDLAQVTPLRGNPISVGAAGTPGTYVCGAPYGPTGGVPAGAPGNALNISVPAGETCRQYFSIVNITDQGGNGSYNGDGSGTVPFRPYMSYFGQATAGQANLNYADFTGYSNYNALQAVWKGRIDSRGSIYQFSYTWSKALGLEGGINGLCCVDISDNLNPRLDYGPTGFDRPQMFTGSVLYAIPGVKSGSALEKNVLNGWSVDPVVTFTSGVPIVPGTGADLWGTSTNSDRPNLVPGQSCRSHGSGIENLWLNPNKFTINNEVLGTDGNASVGNCYGPGANNWDIAIHKDFKISDRMAVQFRLEMFNAFNHTQFEGVNGGLNPTSLCFGDATGALIPVPSSNPALNAADQCYLVGNPTGTQNLPPNAYQVIPGPGGLSSTLISPNSISQTGFGQATFTRPPRQIQYALRFTF